MGPIIFFQRAFLLKDGIFQQKRFFIGAFYLVRFQDLASVMSHASISRKRVQNKGKDGLSMTRMNYVKVLLPLAATSLSLTIAACGGGEGPIVPPPPAPPEYADKHMPEGWWADEDIVEEGRKIFIGQTNMDVNCASCHGKDGKPKKAGARDFRVADRMKLYSDSVWFWRVSEGVPNTKMKPWKTKLSEEDRWKVIAYERTFGLKGMEYDVVKKDWVPVGTAMKPGEAVPASDGAAPAAEGEAKGSEAEPAEGEAKPAEGEATKTSEGEKK